MRRTALGILIALLTLLPVTGFSTMRVISSTGADSGTCAAPNSCATLDYAAGFTVGGDTIGWIPSATMYTSTGNPGSFPSGIVANTFPPHTSNYIWLMGLGDPNVAEGWGDIRFPTSCVIFNGGSAQFGIDKSSYVVWKNFYGIDGNGAIVARDSNHVKFIKIGLKNPTPHAATYTAGVTFASAGDTGFIWGTDDSLLEDVWVIGEARYSVIIGGTAGFSEHNILRRVVVRWDGNSGNQPSAPISIYGATSGVDGARNEWLQNCVVLDNNASSFKSGESIYGMIYFPHSATNINIFDSIIFANAAGYGMIPGEDSASNNAVYNSLIFGQTGPGIITNSGSISSTTFRNNTIGMNRGGDGVAFYSGGSNYRFENNQFYRMGGSIANMTVDNFNGYFPSTSNPTGSTNENLNDPNLLVGSSVNPTSTQYGGGLNGANIGCTITHQRGQSGALWNDAGWNDLQTTPVFPWPYWGQLKALMAKADSGSALANNGSNVTTRGWAGTSVPLEEYTYNGVKLGYAAGALEGGGGEPPPDVPTTAPATFQKGNGLQRGNFIRKSKLETPFIRENFYALLPRRD